METELEVHVEVDEAIVRNYDEKTRDVSRHWKPLGVLLNVDEPLLRRIKDENPNDEDACKLCMLHTWLRGNPDSSENKLDKALEEIRHLDGTNQEVDTARVDSEIERQIMEFKQDFTDILIETYAWLKKNHPNVELAILWVNGRTIGPKGTPLVAEGPIENYMDLGKELQKQWRYTCPDMLSQFLEQEGTVNLKQKMREYKTSFDKFQCNFKLERTTIFQPLDDDKPCLIIVFESGTSLYDIEVFLKDVFGRCKCHLEYQRIEVSCVKVFLQFPASMKVLLEECIKFYNKKQEAAKQNKVNMCIKLPTEMTERNLIIHDTLPPKTPNQELHVIQTNTFPVLAV